ncbi:MAG: porin [Proteobacteria bacterium]|nr:porin [Pseudomonadota bacterium]
MRHYFLAGAAALTAAFGLAGAARAQVSSPVLTGHISPGSIVVRLGGRVSFFAGVSSFTGQSNNGTKDAGFNFGSYYRLYPGFDGVAANGLQYGAQAEIRENASASPGTNPGGETLYVLREFGYLGLPKAGVVRVGQQEGALYLFDTGRFESGPEAFDDGGWNGDIQAFFVNASARPVYPFTWNNNLRATDKIDYVSPAWAGLSFGLSFEPNQANGNYAPSVVSQPGGADLRRNTLEVGVRYQTTVDALGINLSGGYLTAAPIANSSGANKYQTMSVGSVGATLTYAGLTFGGNAKFGNMNGLYEPNPVGAKNAAGFLAGAVYTVGPLSVGGSYFLYDDQGSYSKPAVLGQEQNIGVAAGATYILVPGVKLYASYLYGTRHQGGFNYLTNAPGAAYNNTQAQVFALGTWLYW